MELTETKSPKESRGIGIKRCVKKFIQTTTVRGVARAFRTDEPLVSAVWTLAIVFCASMLFYQLHLVITKYQKYDFLTITKEDTRSDSKFPDVTICNVYPFDHQEDNPLTWQAYQAEMRAKKQRWPFERMKTIEPNLPEDYYNDIWEDLSTPIAFLTNNLANTTSLLPTKQQLIFACELFHKDWNSVTDVDCMSTISFRFEPTYQRCFTIHVPDSRAKDVLAMTTVIYLDNIFPIEMFEFHANARHSLATGARVAVHGRGTLPPMKRGITVAPGVETTISVSQQHRIRLPEPWGNCVDNENIDIHDGVRYSVESCYEICGQENVIAKCGCVLPVLMFSDDQLRRVNGTICTSQTSSDGKFPTSPSEPRDGFWTLFCLYQIDWKWDIYSCDCRWPCVEETYDSTVSSSGAWPHNAYLNAFFATVSSDERYASKLNRYLEQSGTTKATLVRENFLQLNVVLKAAFPLVAEDKPAMTAAILWSNVGGVMSLWLGVTVMFFVELIELFVVIVKQLRQPRQSSAREYKPSKQSDEDA